MPQKPWAWREESGGGGGGGRLGGGLGLGCEAGCHELRALGARQAVPFRPPPRLQASTRTCVTAPGAGNPPARQARLDEVEHPVLHAVDERGDRACRAGRRGGRHRGPAASAGCEEQCSKGKHQRSTEADRWEQAQAVRRGLPCPPSPPPCSSSGATTSSRQRKRCSGRHGPMANPLTAAAARAAAGAHAQHRLHLSAAPARLRCMVAQRVGRHLAQRRAHAPQNGGGHHLRQQGGSRGSAGGRGADGPGAGHRRPAGAMPACSTGAHLRHPAGHTLPSRLLPRPWR